MKISVLMPTYECPSDLLMQSLASVFSQAHEDIELIIKDGSQNHSAIENVDVRNIYCAFADKIVYVNAPETPPPDQIGRFGHNGFYEALNFCVQAATGDILCLLCSDDELGAKDTLSYVNSEFEQHGSDPFLLYGSCDWIDRNGKYIDAKKPPEVTFESLLRDYTLFTPALFWNKAVHQNFGFFNQNLAWCADMDFWLRCWRYIDTKRTTRTLGRYRVWDVSQARANEDSLQKQSLLIQKSHK